MSAAPAADQLAALTDAGPGTAVVIGDPAHPLPKEAFRRPPPQDAWLVVGTSGSTGAPRAIVRSRASWFDSHPAYTALSGLTADDVLLLTGPLTSTMQLFAAVHAMAIGAQVTTDPLAATAAVAVPAVLPAVAAAPAVRSVVVAGAALSPAVERSALARGWRVAEYYGAAELSFVAARVAPAPLMPFPGVQVAIRDGVLWSRSPFHASGYLDGTAIRRDVDGFATVGDLAGWRSDGSLHIVGRGDAAIDVGGSTVIVEDVERLLSEIPGVLDVAVGGIPHPRWGAMCAALVVLDGGSTLAGVRAHARLRLSGAWLPRRWQQLSHLPRTPAGKVDRGAVRELLVTSGLTLDSPAARWSAEDDPRSGAS